jgi:tetratricopeptide (TPR) repeat protein
MLRWQSGANADYRAGIARPLLEISPYCPLGRAVLIETKGAEGIQWEAQRRAKPDPSVQLAPGRHHYASLAKWDEAEKCFNKRIDLSPDAVAYEALADVYKSQKKIDRWRQTLEASLKEEDTGLHHAQVRVQIAREYFRNKDFKSALPYVEAAAPTGAGWAMLAAGECYEGPGDWDRAEQMVRAASERYTDGWFNWYLWCRRTGHGDVRAAEAFTNTWLEEAGARLSGADLVYASAVYQLSDKPDKAFEAVDKRVHLQATPLGVFLLAALQDSWDKPADRDRTPGWLQLPADSPAKKLARLFLDSAKAGASGRLDLEAVEAVLAAMEPAERTNYQYFVGHFLACRGDMKNAAVYLEHCAEAAERDVELFRALAAVELREKVRTAGKKP